MSEKIGKLQPWVELVQTLVTICLIPWGTWVTTQIFTHNGEIHGLQQWQDARPKFVTVAEQDAALALTRETLRKERDVMFKDIQSDLKEILKIIQENRMELIKHTSKQP